MNLVCMCRHWFLFSAQFNFLIQSFVSAQPLALAVSYLRAEPMPWMSLPDFCQACDGEVTDIGGLMQASQGDLQMCSLLEEQGGASLGTCKDIL